MLIVLLRESNLLFFSRKLDLIYFNKKRYVAWIKEIFLKRQVLKFMFRFGHNIEIQSLHVKNCMLDYVKKDKKNFYIKSDIDVTNESFNLPKRYDFNNQINFLFIVGPHFQYIHKNISDFSNYWIIMLFNYFF